MKYCFIIFFSTILLLQTYLFSAYSAEKLDLPSVKTFECKNKAMQEIAKEMSGWSIELLKLLW